MVSPVQFGGRGRSTGCTSGTRRWLHLLPGAEAHLTGELAVCAGSCGPGNLHLINGLFDCHRSRVPVLAIAWSNLARVHPSCVYPTLLRLQARRPQRVTAGCISRYGTAFARRSSRMVPACGSTPRAL